MTYFELAYWLLVGLLLTFWYHSVLDALPTPASRRLAFWAAAALAIVGWIL